MSDNVQLPALGESVTEGTVTRWLKNVGDRVEVDEPLLEISTDKVDTEVPSPFAGVLEQILVAEDETAEVGAVLAVIGDGSGAGGDAPAQESAPAEEAPAQQAGATTQGEGYGDPAPEVEAASPATEQPAAAPAAEAQGSGDGQQVTLPALGESVTEGTVTRWLKQVGDTVEVDEPLLEISTDKVDTEVPSPFAGTLQQILVGEDETAEVGAPLAVIGSGSAPAASGQSQDGAAQAAAPAATEAAPQAAAPEEAPAPTPAPVPAPTQSAPAAPAAPAPAPQQAAPAQAQGSYLTPLVRKLAAEKGVDTSTLTGTGVGGRIRKEDVLEAAAKAEEAAKAAAAQQAPAAAPSAPSAPAKAVEPSPLRGTTEKASRLRQVIAERMVDALHSQAQLTSVVEVDVTRVARLRAKAKDSFKAREGVNLTFLPFFVQAAVEALKVHPKINAVLEGKEITYHGTENIGIAVDTERGLVVPVIRDAGDLNLAGIGRKIADLAGRTRANKVTPDELSGATFTVTNTGSGGALFDTPIVPGGTSAILGTGAIVKRPVVIKDADGAEVIAIRSMCYLALSYDHRLVDGADASRYLMTVKQRIEEGAFEAEVGL
ncbi:2-oxoglutarate dehydrogenase, E2 component, dihydrolipoamide succinyltransferase [Cellulomonas hominis]|uniref:Dihydrolipoamide acetyltransferase component of pyruvate dehydrogenase complex n=1 Tax=Cellulomonas hominis TaxID=156981 RepID=A0A7Z8JZG2_9CELL|nr:2-oxoglutarate dehydrogenase, E2 component, dihydrolipoamide succinyltransferase [Cellulomonas hominis]TKR23725.1 2-oxoglutarate dehydrogenase, E2 component, dihydrolipoamide succinyltransferase [Cellulomonas hominis]